MADEPTELVLRLLREIRSEVSEVRRVQDLHSAKFAEHGHRLEEIHESLYAALGMSAHANVRHDAVQKQLDELRERVARLEEKA